MDLSASNLLQVDQLVTDSILKLENGQAKFLRGTLLAQLLLLREFTWLIKILDKV